MSTHKIEVYDVIIIGSGPAGVSAAYPLVESGHKVLMVDGGSGDKDSDVDSSQAGWFLPPPDVMSNENISPKLRIPKLKYVFDGFIAHNHIKTQNFFAVGSLASGGLSNAWGGGVAIY